MAITLKQSGTNSVVSTSGNTVTLGSTPVAGDLLYAVAYDFNQAIATGSVTDTAGGTWTQLVDGLDKSNHQGAGGSTPCESIWYRVVQAGESWGATPQITCAWFVSPSYQFDVFEFQGAVNGWLLDQTGIAGRATAGTGLNPMTIGASKAPGASAFAIGSATFNNANTVPNSSLTYNGSALATNSVLNSTRYHTAYGAITSASNPSTNGWTNNSSATAAEAMFTFLDASTTTAAGSITFGGTAAPSGDTASGSISFGGTAAPSGDTAAASITFNGSTASISTATGSISFGGTADQLGASALGSITFGGTATGTAGAAALSPFMTAMPGLLMPGDAFIGAAPFLAIGETSASGSITFGGAGQPGVNTPGSISFGGAGQVGVSTLGSISFGGTASGTPTGNFGAQGSITFGATANLLGVSAQGSISINGASVSGTATYRAVGSISFGGAADLLAADAIGSISFGGGANLVIEPPAYVFNARPRSLVFTARPLYAI